MIGRDAAAALQPFADQYLADIISFAEFRDPQPRGCGPDSPLTSRASGCSTFRAGLEVSGGRACGAQTTSNEVAEHSAPRGVASEPHAGANGGGNRAPTCG